MKHQSFSTFTNKKQRHEKIVMVTCYDYPTALIEDRAGVDIVLVGDSLGTNVLGYPDVKLVTMEDMLHHLRAVRRGIASSFIMCDMPYKSYDDPLTACHNGRKLLDAGADAVKVEGEIPDVIAAMVADNIPVCGHLGFTPQSNALPAIQGKEVAQAREILAAARAIESAGAKMLVLELVTEELASAISLKCVIPVIGIGAGRGCDGQVQVIHDLTGLSERTFKHAKANASVGEQTRKAVETYCAEVRDQKFPMEQNVSHMSASAIKEFLALQNS